MEFKVSLENASISIVDHAPPITDWLSKEAARWIQRKYGQEVKVEITGYDEKVSLEHTAIREQEGK